jgi:predicted deacylase
MLPWVQLRAAAGPERPVPPGCYAAVFEMRGMAAIDDKLAAADAAGLYRHLQRLGAIAGDPGEPDVAQVAVVPVSEELSTPVAGLVVYPAPLGQRVEPGDLVAEILDPSAEPGTPRTALHAGMTGHIISRRLQRIVGPGDFVAMIVGPAANGARG